VHDIKVYKGFVEEDNHVDEGFTLDENRVDECFTVRVMKASVIMSC
jgi:hypothetical protein